MSNSLVRQGLELLGYEKEVKQEKKKKKKQVKYKGALDLIPPKHRIVSKHDKTDLGSALGRSGKTTIYDAKRKKTAARNLTNTAVKRLLLLSKNRIDPKITGKLLDRAVNRRYLPKKEKPKEPETTAFTEEDFKKFEQEYVEQ